MHHRLMKRRMPVPLRLRPPATVLTTLLSGLKLSLVRMMPVTQRPKILRRIIVMNRITLLMVHLIRIGTAQSHTPVIILNRPLAPMPVTIQYQSANPRPIRIEPPLTLTKPNHTNPTKKKQGWPVLSRRNQTKGETTQQEKFSDQPTQVLQVGVEPTRHKTTHSECAASTIPPPKQKNRQPPRHTHQKHGGCPSSNTNRQKEIQWQKWLFTASHGARMLRESNPRTVPSRHLSEVVQ